VAHAPSSSSACDPRDRQTRGRRALSRHDQSLFTVGFYAALAFLDEPDNQCGPVGFLTVLPSGPPAMGKNLVQWFLYCVVISIFAAYLSGRTLPPGTAFLQVFRVVGFAALLGYYGSQGANFTAGGRVSFRRSRKSATRFW
jgi:hypothetical protein